MARQMETETRGHDGVSGREVGEDIAALREDMDKIVSDIAKIARQEVRSGLGAGSELKEAMERQADQVAGSTRDLVRENPIGACAAAAAAGFAVALLLRR